jgi:hypothetical protein
MQEKKRKSEPPAHPTTHHFVSKLDPARVSSKGAKEKKKVVRPPTPLLTVSIRKSNLLV